MVVVIAVRNLIRRHLLPTAPIVTLLRETRTLVVPNASAYS